MTLTCFIKAGRPLLAIAITLGLGQRAYAQQDPVELAPSTVTLDKDAPQPVGDARTHIDPAAYAGTGDTIPTMLRRVPGVSVRRMGDVGSFTSIAVRGLGGDNVGVVLDDLPLNNTSLGPIDLSLFPLESLQSIDVYRGGGPVRFQNPLGGMIHLHTLSPGDKLHLSAHAGIGSYLTRRAHVAAAGPWGDALRYSAFAGYQGSAGNFTYYNDRNTLYTTADDVIEPRANNRSDALLARAALNTRQGLAPGHGLFRLSAQTAWRSQGVPGPGAVLTHHTHATDVETTVRAALAEALFLAERLRLDAAVDALFGQRYFADPDREIGLRLGSSNAWVRTVGADATLELSPSIAHTVLVAPRLSFEDVHITNIAQDPGGLLQQDRALFGLGIEYRVDLTDVWRLIPSVRVDALRDTTAHQTTQDQQASPRLGALCTAGPVEARANVGHYHRFPTLTERFGDGVVTAANPTLAPEFGWSADLGATLAIPTQAWLERATLTLDVFGTRADNLIVLVPNTPSTLIPLNVGRSNIVGAEASAEWQWAILHARAAYTAMAARDASGTLGLDGKQTPGIPGQQLDASLEARVRPVMLRYEATFTQLMFLDRANLRPLPARLFHNIYAEIELPIPALIARLTVNNLTDLIHETVPVQGAPGGVGVSKIADVLGYPLPGRTVFASLSWSHE